MYRARVVPLVRRELGRWRAGAPRRSPTRTCAPTALAAIDEKGLNVEATAVFAILAPRADRGRPRSRAMVALQVAVDYLDTLGEQPVGGAAGDGLRLHGALADRGLAGRPYGGLVPPSPRATTAATWPPWSPTPRGGRGAAAAEAVCRRLGRAAARCGEGQSHTHAAEHGRPRPRSRPGPRAQAAPPVYRWWEVAAGASSSVAAHALIAAAADPRTSAAEAELIDAAYFPSIGALTVLLDDLVDRDEDAAAGAHNYLAYYARRRGRGGPPRPRSPHLARAAARPAAPPPPPRRDPRRRRRLLPQRRGGGDALRPPGPRAPAALDRPGGAADRRLHAPAPARAEAQTARRQQGAPPGHDVCAHGPWPPRESGTVRAWYQGPQPEQGEPCLSDANYK